MAVGLGDKWASRAADPALRGLTDELKVKLLSLCPSFFLFTLSQYYDSFFFFFLPSVKKTVTTLLLRYFAQQLLKLLQTLLNSSPVVCSAISWKASHSANLFVQQTISSIQTTFTNSLGLGIPCTHLKWTFESQVNTWSLVPGHIYIDQPQRNSLKSFI